MRKLTLFFLTALFTLTVFSGCGGPAQSQDSPIQEPGVAEMAAKIQENNEFGMIMDTDESMITEWTQLDFDLVEEFIAKDAVNIQSYVLYVFKAKDAKDLPAIQDALAKRLEMIQKSFEQYLPDPYQLSLQGQVVTNGRYVLLAIAGDTPQAVADFNSFFAP